MRGEYEIRIVVLLSVACASCAVDPISPNIWSLARTDANGQNRIHGHYTLEGPASARAWNGSPKCAIAACCSAA